MGLVTIQILYGADKGRVFDNLAPTVTIGREEGNTIQLNDERVSRFHLKIQEDNEQFVLTDLDSTNGTKVNNEDIHLRILRYGDLISVGRSILLFGSREQVAQRLAALRAAGPDALADSRTIGQGEIDGEEEPPPGSLDFELNWGTDSNSQSTLQTLMPPELPTRLSPGQAAQLAEIFEYLHLRMRDLISTVQPDRGADTVRLDARQWQALLDVQGRLAQYLREIGEPS